MINVGGVGLGIGLLIEVLDFTVWTNHHPDACSIASTGTFAGTISEAHGPFGVAKQRKIEGKLLGEVFVLFNGVKADA